MKMRCIAPMRIAKIGYIVMSVVFCIAGILCIAKPDVSAKAIGLFTGTAMIIFGAVKLVGYFSKDLYRLAFQFDLGSGILLLVLGLILLTNPEGLMRFLCTVLGIFVLTDSLFKMQTALDSKRFGIKNWWLIMAMSMLGGLAGLFLVICSASGAQLLTALLGVSLLAEGILNLCTVLNTVRIVRHQKPDVIETDDYEIK